MTHRLSLVPGVAICGAKRVDGAVFSRQGRKPGCPVCLEKIAERRAAAQARFAAAGGGR